MKHSGGWKKTGRETLAALSSNWLMGRLLYAAADLKLAEELSLVHARSAKSIARRLNADPAALLKLLRGLSCMGIVRLVADGRFVSTPLIDFLRADHPKSIRTLVLFAGSEIQWLAWGKIVETMKSGKPGFDAAFGMPLFSYLEKNAQTAAIFNDAMLATSETRFREFAARFPLGRARTLVDIGGGTGALLEATLSAHPKLNGVLFDRPAVIAQARRRMNPLLAKRCRFISGDFFRALPELSADVYVLRNILHDWDDQRALRILRNCRARMTPKSKLLILEILLTARPSAVQAFEDLQMLILTGGKERTRSQYDALLASSGFRIRRVVRIGFPQNVIEAVPV